MKKLKTLLCAIVLGNGVVIGQSFPEAYTSLVSKADSLYNKKEFKISALTYSAAFKAAGWKPAPNDRYNAACTWALAGVADSAFFHLQILATRHSMKNYGHVTTDTDLVSLYGDPRWKPLLAIVKQNQEKAEANYNKPLVQRLDSIYLEDQGNRMKIDAIEKKYGWKSKEMDQLLKRMTFYDSVNLIKVTRILDQYGWLGPDIIGDQGNSTLFLVIQHSNQKTQEKYLPMMRDAVKKGKAAAAQLALLEDRVALGQGRRQIYGSQIHQDQTTGKYFVAPIDDEPNVNKRRAAVGLGPLEDYVRQWDIEYKVPAK